MIPDEAVEAADIITSLIAGEFERDGETSGEIITRWQNAEAAARRIIQDRKDAP